MISPARRLSAVKPHLFARLNRRKAELRAASVDVIALDMGSPDLPPAPHIVEALVRSARRPDSYGYGEFSGSPAVKRAFAYFYAQRFGVELDPEREVLLLLGSKEGIYHLSFAYLDPGDVALVPDPGYPTYAAAARLAGATVHAVPLERVRGTRGDGVDGVNGVGSVGGVNGVSSVGGVEDVMWLPALERIPKDVAARAKVLWLNYPNNPTASIAPRTFFERAVAFCQQHSILLAHDNAYSETGYDGYRAPSVLQVRGAKDIAIEFFSLSKAYNVAGMRVGALVGHPEVVKTVAALKSNVDTGAFAAIQDAAIAALTGDQSWLEARQEIYRRRRDLCVAALRALGCEVALPHATIYLWARLPHGETDSAAWCAAVLEAAGVSFTPGVAFGQSGEGYFRVALTAPLERLREAMERLAAYVQRSDRPSATGTDGAHDHCLEHAVLA
ncbi:MAG: aminotransferase class I/II-fold pyridoxal phosphate-dependent enzyme [Anaerolineae bacterium]|nr:aminotransferase class I/II-fold pyridoxal phosphate-dependent enzyme [Candidatus Roseilinea sp.]MDW8450647.1 aminotransferase class I/II-fold pyridoxal phosphate-dependent enzyme [Anaerolineae bacterium]